MMPLASRKNHKLFIRIGELLERRRDLMEQGKDLTDIEAQIAKLGHPIWAGSRSVGRPAAQIDGRKLVKMRATGMTIAELAHDFNCSTATVLRHLRNMDGRVKKL